MTQQGELIPAKEVDVTFIDFEGKLQIPENPLVFKARELQSICEKYKKFLEHKPQLFNMTSYIAALNLYISTIREIKGEKPDDIPDSGSMDGVGDDAGSREMGDTTALGLDSRVSPDNPLTR